MRGEDRGDVGVFQLKNRSNFNQGLKSVRSLNFM